MTKSPKLAALLIAVAALSGACGGGETGPEVARPTSTPTSTATTPMSTADDAPVAAEVAIKDFAYGPKEVSVSVGETVRWTNADAFEHTVTSGTPDRKGGKFDETVDAGKTATVTFEEAGRFAYFCQRHTFMTGEVTVS